jgi:hypothetical protein
MRDSCNIRAALLVCLVLAATPAGAAAADRYVARSGKDRNNDCTVPSAPCKSIARALAVAASGDSVHIAAGRYRASLRFDSTITLAVLGGWDATFTTRDPIANVTELRGRSRRYPIGRADRRVCRVTAAPGVTINLELDGLTLTRGHAKWPGEFLGDPQIGTILDGGGALHVTAHGGSAAVTLRRSVITRNSSKLEVGGAVFVGAVAGTASATFDRVLFSDNRADYGGAMYVHGSSPGYATAVLVNSIITDHESEGSAAFFVKGQGPPGSAVVELRNSTIVGNVGEEEEEGAIVLNQGVLNAHNSIIWGNPLETGTPGGDLTVGVLGVANLDHCDVGDSLTISGMGGVINDLGGNVSIDPQLAGFELAAISPLIDAGSCSGAPSVDFGGDPRPSGVTCDIGADEYVP